MPEEHRISVADVRKTIATSLGAAFGFVIALVWSQVVMGGLAVAGVQLQAAGDLTGWMIGTLTAVVLTVVMIVLIVVISRWGGKA